MIEFIAFLSLVGMILGTVNVFNMIHKEKEHTFIVYKK